MKQFTTPPEPKKKPKHKDERIEFRADPDLKKRASKKARKHGGLGAVLRALLRLWTDEDIDPNLIGDEHRRAPKRKKKKTTKKKAARKKKSGKK